MTRSSSLHSTRTGSSRALSAAISVRRSAVSAACAACMTLNGWRWRLPSNVRWIRPFVATSSGRRSQSRADRRPTARGAAAGAEAVRRVGARVADGVQQHEVADAVGVIVGEAGGDPATEAVPEHEHGLVGVDGVEEPVDPCRVADECPLQHRELVAVPEPGQRGCDHAAPSCRQPAQRPPVRLVVEAPPVEEQHGHATPAAREADPAAVDLHRRRDQLVAHETQPGSPARWRGPGRTTETYRRFHETTVRPPRAPDREHHVNGLVRRAVARPGPTAARRPGSPRRCARTSSA